MAKAIGLYARMHICICLSNTFTTVWFMTHMTLLPSIVQSVLCCHTRSLCTQQIVFGFSKTSSASVSNKFLVSAKKFQQKFVSISNNYFSVRNNYLGRSLSDNILQKRKVRRNILCKQAGHQAYIDTSSKIQKWRIRLSEKQSK